MLFNEYPLVKHSPQRQPVLKSEAGRLRPGDLGTEVPRRGPGAEPHGGGLRAKPPEAERLSRLWRVISTLNPTLKVIIPSGNWAYSRDCLSFVNRIIIVI